MVEKPDAAHRIRLSDSTGSSLLEDGVQDSTIAHQWRATLSESLHKIALSRGIQIQSHNRGNSSNPLEAPVTGSCIPDMGSPCVAGCPKVLFVRRVIVASLDVAQHCGQVLTSDRLVIRSDNAVPS